MEGALYCTSSLRATSGYCTLTRNHESTKHGPDKDQGIDPSPERTLKPLSQTSSIGSVSLESPRVVQVLAADH